MLGHFFINAQVMNAQGVPMGKLHKIDQTIAPEV
jgi:hypothetical protein